MTAQAGRKLAGPVAVFYAFSKKVCPDGKPCCSSICFKLLRGARLCAQGRADLDAEQAFCYCWRMFAIPAGVAA